MEAVHRQNWINGGASDIGCLRASVVEAMVRVLQLAVVPGGWTVSANPCDIDNISWNAHTQSFLAFSVIKSMLVDTFVKVHLSPLFQYLEGSQGCLPQSLSCFLHLSKAGELHLSHGIRKDVIDSSPHSAFSISVFSWYTDVFHEVKPSTSGYRLAFSYNLVHTSPNSPLPSLPTSDSGVEALRMILTEGRYGDDPGQPE